MIPNLSERCREDQLNEVLLAYVEATEAGQKLDREEWLANHPDLRDDLAAFFTSYDQVERLAAPLRQCGTWSADGTTSVESMAPLPPSSADVLHANLGQLGDFRLIREVGRGGMGVVYEAEQLSLHRRVALKILPFAAAVDPRQLQRFKNEATAAGNLRHENIVPVHAVGSERGVHYYAMQFVDGQSLAALISELRSPAENVVKSLPAGNTIPLAKLATERDTGGPAHFDWAAGLARQAALALEHAHQSGIVHRDVKPGNLLLDTRGQLWVADFGLAQFTGDAGLTATGEVLGTLRYASPEQALGRRGVVDQRSDVYSLGATLYELLTLRPPFDGHDRHELLRQIADDAPPAPRSIHSAIPAGLETIVLKALRKEPADRYATAQEFADDLQRFLERRPTLARPPSSAERFRMWSRRHPAGLLVGAVVLLLVTVGSVVSMALVGAEQERTRTEQHRAEDAYQRERLRAEEAETRLTLARRAIDELFRVSEEELADRPGMEMLRKRLLRSALAYYQEFLVERRDDPSSHAELLETTQRVEGILADLAVLRAATHFYLLCQQSVLDDLHLTAQQRRKIKELTARVGKEWMESFHDIGLVSAAERGQRTIALARNDEAELNAILTPQQQARVRQIGLQADGSSAFRDPDVAAALGLTLPQREQIRTIEDDALFGWMRWPAPGASSMGKPGGNREKLSKERILAVLTEEQKQRWQAMNGTPLKGTITPFRSPPPFQGAPGTKMPPR